MSEALLASAALVGLAVLWYVFLRGGNGGCTSHHFTNWQGTQAVRAITGPANDFCYDYKVVVKRKYSARCEHEGCDERGTDWRHERTEAFAFA